MENKISNVLPKPIVFFCKDCNKIVDAKPIGKKFVYKCSICGTKNVAFGTEEAIKNYYHFDEAKVSKSDGDEKKNIVSNS